MSTNQAQRPKFYQNQYLGAEDLTAALAYGRIQRARHALGAHTWGIAMGLQLKEKDSPAGGGQVDVYIQPGYSWDGFGRPIVVLSPYKIPQEKFKSYLFDAAIDGGTPEGRLIPVWLRYDESATRAPRPGFEVCDPEDQHSRVQETFQIEIGERPTHSDQHDPISVAGYSVDAQDALQKLDPETPPIAIFDESIPYQNFPEEGEKVRWLIPLGYVRWKPNPNANQPGNFVKRDAQDLTKSRSLRRYIGVVAESVHAADGVIRMRDRTKDYSQVRSNDLVWVEGSLRVEGDVKLFAHKLDFRRDDGLEGPADDSNDVPLFIRRSGDGAPGGVGLQVVIGKAAGGNNNLSVGPLDSNGQFQAKLIVKDNGNVGVGTTSPDRSLTIANAIGANYMNVKDGTREILMGVDGNGGIVSVMSNHDLILRAGTNSEKMRITASGNVGIGTTGPDRSLTIANAIGANYMNVKDGTREILMGVDGNGGIVSVMSNHDLILRAGTNSEKMRITASGNVGIGTASPGYLLHVNGEAAKPGGGAWTASSDERLKKNIEPLKDALGKLTSLRGVSYEWKDPKKHGNLTGKQMGLIGQEVEKVFPEWVGTDQDGYKDLTIRGFEALTIEAFREIKEQNEQLKAQMKKFEAKIKALEK